MDLLSRGSMPKIKSPCCTIHSFTNGQAACVMASLLCFITAALLQAVGLIRPLNVCKACMPFLGERVWGGKGPTTSCMPLGEEKAGHFLHVLCSDNFFLGGGRSGERGGGEEGSGSGMQGPYLEGAGTIPCIWPLPVCLLFRLHLQRLLRSRQVGLAVDLADCLLN